MNGSFQYNFLLKRNSHLNKFVVYPLNYKSPVGRYFRYFTMLVLSIKEMEYRLNVRSIKITSLFQMFPEISISLCTFKTDIFSKHFVPVTFLIIWLLIISIFMFCGLLLSSGLHSKLHKFCNCAKFENFKTKNKLKNNKSGKSHVSMNLWWPLFCEEATKKCTGNLKNRTDENS